MRKSDIESFAHKTLIEHGIYSIPVDPVILANKLGIKVSNAVFYDCKTRRKTSVLVNANDSLTRKKFTIAHELGHDLLHLVEDGEFIDHEVDLFRNESDASTDKSKEIEANQFADALLMDAELIKKFWPEYKSIEGMADFFKVSEATMGIRISSLGLI